MYLKFTAFLDPTLQPMSDIATPKPLFVVRKSPIHHYGVFATENIPKASKIVEYLGEKITKKVSLMRAQAREAHAKKTQGARVYIFDLNKRYDLDGDIPHNPAKYINHSCEPNCEAVNLRGHIWIIAKKTIKKGEELSFNYNYEWDHCLDHPCYCNTPSCLGYIVKPRLRAKLKRYLQKAHSTIPPSTV